MELTDPDSDDTELAVRIAREAGELLLALRNAVSDPSRRRAEGDRQANELILERLAVARPDDAVLSEEAPPDPRATDAERLWIIDPLDGTREFGDGDRIDWAVHVALLEHGALGVGAVALPARGLVLATRPAPVLAARDDVPLRILVSRSRPPAIAIRLAEALDGELVEMGSAGAKAMAVVLGEGDVYPHSGGQYQWDSAAPVAVAAAAGLHASRLDGSPLAYGGPDPWLPDLLVCRPELTVRVRAAITDATGT